MDDSGYSIGELARRTGLTVKAIRFYSDRGVVAPSGRTVSGHRRYGTEALARLEFVRTLRELGLDLATIRKVADSEVALSDVAAAHLQAMEVQIRVLRLRHAVLTAVTKRGSTPEEMTLMHQLAKLTQDERRRLIGDFLATTFRGLEHPAFAGIARSMTPELPDDPEAEQVEAWVELAEFSEDPDFRALMRRIAEQHDAGRTGIGVCRDAAADIRDAVTPALDAGIDPSSSEAARVVAALSSRHGPDRLLAWLDIVGDSRRERYFELLAVINGWAAPDSLAPVSQWLSDALRAPARVAG
ncbi:MerR family transcriptional regulator [Amycolatopsis oliviviridis]|uniref:MerR family transcriptional regulator n=1 Tax=Amycolatopsis oliviviridis TaxID=1471590 RepID=A0ABQ3LCH5_9PSEU|nr:MerR family transcriptional regulator [Amycolatopsis oliviviridis]GHH02381.1 MerR family transcriptional regulator [Amycolatopsis oliviviridis]